MVDKMLEIRYNDDGNTVQRGDEMKNIGEAVREVRKKAGLTQEQLAEKAGISRGHVVEIEANRYSPMVKTLAAIADACGVELKIFE